MPRIPFSDLPDSARIWIFPASRPLDDAEADLLLGRVDRFLEDWRAHGRPVVGGGEWRHDRFLIVGADEAATGVSGCSIDGLFRALQETEQALGVGLRDSSPIWFRNGAGEIECLSRPEFRARVRDGGVDPDTPVFDHTVTTAGEVRGGRWEVPMRDSWHARVFRVGAASGQ